MKKVLLALLLLSCGIAQATEGPIYVLSPPHPTKPHKQDKRQSIANNNAAAAAASAASAAVVTGNTSAAATTGNQSSTQSINAARTAATAYSGNIAPTAVCMGTSSAGVQGLALGVSVGSSWTDKNCMLLEQVRAVATVLGDKVTAEEMMCGMEQYRDARIRLGNPCLADKSQQLNQFAGSQIIDPVIRYRLGLPPLQ